MHFSSGAVDALLNYSWPGNVRELENEVKKRAAILADSDVIDEKALSEHVRGIVGTGSKPVPASQDVSQYAPTSLEKTATTLKEAIEEAVEEVEIHIIKQALEKSGGNKQKAAKILGLTRQGLIKKLKKLGNLLEVKPSAKSGAPITNQTAAPKPMDVDKQAGEQEQAVRPLSIGLRTGDSLRRGSGQASMKLRTQGSLQAERRQLSVMFCDLVGFASISEQVDPEDLREIILAYLDVCSGVISRYDGHISKHFGDGLLAYFGYPVAHEDDAQRAVQAGIGIVWAIHELPLQSTRLQIPLQARVGIHTGLVVIGGMGVENMPESIAIVGEAPNIATQLLSVAEPNTVVISSATHQLVGGLFHYNYLGQHTLKGVSTPLEVYRVLHESGVQSRFEAAVIKGLTPLVGREKEVELLLDRWERAKGGEGQAILISGEPGIGKSRLVQALKERLAEDAHVKIESRCSPFYQNSALYPVIDHLQRFLFGRKIPQKRRRGSLRGG